VTVGSNIAGYTPVAGDETRELLLGAPEVGERALLRFYVLHVYVLPALLTTLLAVHIWRVRKDGLAAGKPDVTAATLDRDEARDGE
jgi:quinol-cytochrome oxidoreductase complex cytochrome b subunit